MVRNEEVILKILLGVCLKVKGCISQLGTSQGFSNQTSKEVKYNNELILPYSLEYKTHSNARCTPNFETQFEKKKFNFKMHPTWIQMAKINLKKNKKNARIHPCKRRLRIFSSSTTSIPARAFEFWLDIGRLEGTSWKFKGASCRRHLGIFSSCLSVGIRNSNRYRNARAENSKSPFTQGTFEFSARRTTS